MRVADRQLRVLGETCREALCGVSCSRSVVMVEVCDHIAQYKMASMGLGCVRLLVAFTAVCRS